MSGTIYHCQNQPHSLPIFFNLSSDFGSLIGTSGLFLEPQVPDSFVRLLRVYPESNPQRRVRSGGLFLSVSLPSEEGKLVVPGHKLYVVEQQRKVHKVNRVRGGNVVNATKHLWAGAIAAMVSRSDLGFEFLLNRLAGPDLLNATYPFEVLRRKLQLQVQSTKLSIVTTFVKIVEQGGIPALYAGLIPSL